jgi:two-component system, cell cycle response regulator DivK
MAKSSQRTSEPVATARRQVVLLVQPSSDDGLEMYAEFLHYSGLAPVAVSNATDALTFAPEADIIVTGIILDGHMDGVEFVSRLRGDDGTLHKPIIVLTTCASPQEQERAKYAGCDVFLSKPCLPDALLREVRRLLPAMHGFTATRIPRTQMTEHRRASTR